MNPRFKTISLCLLFISFCACNRFRDEGLSIAFDYKNSKESPIFFIAAKSESNFVSETTPLSIDFYFGHDFYVGSYYRDNFEN